VRRYTPHSVTDWSMLETKVAQVQKDDWAWVSQEHELGVQALAVPLRDMSGKTVAALNVVAEIRETQPQRFVKSMLPHLQDAAAEMLPQL
jgi:IclR family transcriptional regulator, pca regulon regulatory protein